MAFIPLSLLLPIICLSATRVASQSVTADQVTTDSLVLNWEKEGEWADVGTYQVSIKVNGHAFCETTKYCFLADSCSFNTADKCGMFPPCANVVATVSGGSYKAPNVSVQSAPAAVTDLQVTGSIMKEVKWTNSESSCIVNTAVSVTYGGYYDYTKILNPSETSLSVPLCNKGSGTVSVRARGGDGESAEVFAALTRLTGDDAVEITGCPTEGCTDITVEWEYNSVCPEVKYFEVTASHELNTVSITVPDLVNTTATFEDLELDTVYRTCVNALDEDHNLMAASCTACGTYPEIVDQLTVVNVTEVTAELEWEAPLCQVDGDIEYYVSYSYLGQKVNSTTTDTSFLWTELSPAVNYKFCVLVRHPGVVPDHVSACSNSYTLPEAPKTIDVRVYKSSSLFVSWPGEIFRPVINYFVTWGDNLEHSDSTEYKSYTIEGYNQTVGPHKVCVQAEIKATPSKRSGKICQEEPFAEFGDSKPDNTAMIVSVSASAGLAVLLSLVLVVAAKREKRHTRGDT